LGVEVDPAENFQMPLAEKMGDLIMKKVDEAILKSGKQKGIAI